MKRFHLLVLAGTIMLGSCTMEKRHFLPGYYTDFKKSRNKTEPDNAAMSAIKKQNPGVGILPSKDIVIANPQQDIPVMPAVRTNSSVTSSAIRKTKIITDQKIKSLQENPQSTSKKPIIQKYPTKNSSAPSSDFPGWAYVLIALILPPLAVGLKYGVHLAFWLCLLFTLLGFVPGLIYALVYLAIQGNNPEK